MRAIVPELIILMGVLLLAGLVLVAVGASQWVAAKAITRKVSEASHRRAQVRQDRARRDARWEVRTSLVGDRARIQLVRVAWLGGAPLVVQTNDDYVEVAMSDSTALLNAQADAEIAARAANGDVL